MSQTVNGGTATTIQDAINAEDGGNGTGEVILTGTFDLGSETVVVNPQNRPLTIRGDATTSNTINNGGGTFVNSAPRSSFDIGVPSQVRTMQPVTIKDLVFTSPRASAIRVLAVSTVVITACTINGVLSVEHLPDAKDPDDYWAAAGIVVAIGGQSNPARLAITANKMTIGATTHQSGQTGAVVLDRTVGIAILAGGSLTVPVDIMISENSVGVTTAFGVDVRGITGKVLVEGNDIKMGGRIAVSNSSQRVLPVSGIRCLKSGQYLLRGNTVSCPNFPNLVGIRLVGDSGAPVKWATVEENEILLSHFPPRRNFGDGSDCEAGIQITGNATENKVRHNTVSGSARSALSVVTDQTQQLIPNRNSFEGNRHSAFSPADSHIVVGPKVIGTRIIAPEESLSLFGTPSAGSVINQGVDTLIAGNYETS